MTDIEQMLRSALHAATDGEEAAPEELITLVKRRHRRHRALMAGTAVVAAVAIATPTALAVHSKITGSGSANPAAAGGHKLPSTLSGLPMPAGKNFKVLVSTTDGAGWYSTATHKTVPIKGLPAVFSGYQFNRVDGGWVAWPINYNSPCNVSECAGPATTFYFISYGSQAATRIGAGYNGNGVGAGTRTGTVWLVTYPRTTFNIGGSAFAQLVTTAGRRLGPRYRLPANYLMQGGVGRYLLLNLDANDYVKSALWDPRTNRILRYFENVLVRSPGLIVWSRGCRGCQLEITNVSTGKTMSTPIPGSHPDDLNATMSDDGRLLAVQLPGGAIEVLDTVTGSLTRLAGTALSLAPIISNGDFEYFGWQNGGHRLLVFAGPNIGAGADQLAYWQPGDAHLYVRTIRNPTDMEQLQTGSQ